MKQARVRFLPGGQEVACPSGATVREAAALAGLEVEGPCAGQGTCGKCRVRLSDPAGEPTTAEREHLTAAELAHGYRLACQVAPHDGLVRVELGWRTYRPEGKVLLSCRSGEVAVDSGVRRRTVELPPPSLADQRPDDLRLAAQLGGGTMLPRELLGRLPGLLRGAGMRLAVVEDGRQVLELGPPPGDGLWGLAADLGTTSLVVGLFDLESGRSLGVAARGNPQARHGADVLSRIQQAGRPGGATELRRLVLEAVNELARELATAAGGVPERIFRAVLVGNTAMEQLFLEVDPTPLGEAPYVGALGGGFSGAAEEVGLAAHRRARVRVFPTVAGYVGGDTVAMLLAAGMRPGSRARLAVDVGTNGEMALAWAGGILTCSAAAGPAFEGANLRDGMRAEPGAVAAVRLTDGDLSLRVLGDVPVRGVCGSGIIDLLAVLRRAGAVDETGRLRSPGEVRLPAGLARRLMETEEGRALRLADGSVRDVCLTQADVRQVQLAKGAIQAGIDLLLREAGLAPSDLREVLLAGTFGNHLDRKSARDLGLLPQVPLGRIRFVGNAAFEGARLALLNHRMEEEADRLARSCRHLELSGHPGFEEAFLAGMAFPPLG